jgi:hypothetical protein
VKVVKSDKNLKKTEGQWSEVATVITKSQQTIDKVRFKRLARITNNEKQTFICFDKPGIIYALNGYDFGKTYWIVTIEKQSAHFSADRNSCLILGVTTSQNRVKRITGLTINYGLN